MEIDENLMRAELTELERMELLKRRKEIYEELHPETKWGYASLKNLKQFRNTEVLSGENFCGGAKRFTKEVEEKTGMSEKTIYKYLQIATNLSEEVEEMIRGTELANRKTDLLSI